MRRRLSGAGEVFSRTLEPDEILDAVARAVVPDLAETVAICLVEDDHVRLARVEDVAPERGESVERFFGSDPGRICAPYGIGAALATGEPHLYDVLRDTPHDAELDELEGRGAIEELLRSSGMCVPFVAGGRTIGAMMMRSAARAHTDADLELAVDLARTAALALDNAQGHARERDLAYKLEREKRIVETLNRVGRVVTARLDLKEVVQVVTDAVTELTHAEFGAFFYNAIGEDGDAYMLYTLSGAPREAFEHFPMPRKTAIFDPTFRGTATMRLDDVTADPRFGKNPPFFGMPERHLPVRSYLAVPVMSAEGEVIGGLFLGHHEAGVFDEETERLAVGIAAQAAIAFRNAQRHEAARHELEERAAAALRLLQVIAVAANEATDENEALQIALDEICAYTGWPVGHALLIDPLRQDVLVSTGAWHVDDAERFAPFVEVSDAMEFSPARGLPGRVMESGRPLWVTDLEAEAKFPRLDAARDVGIRAGFACPILVGQEVVGILEFMATELTPPDQDLVDVVTQIGTQLGRVVERTRNERFRDQFISDAAHELRTPLTSLVGFAHLLGESRDSLDEEQFANVISAINRQGERLRVLVGSLLDFARIRQSRVHLEMERLKLYDVATSAIESTPPPEAKQVTICVDPSLEVIASRLQLEQIVANLAMNAYRYGGTDVEVIGSPGENGTTITVADNGPGVPDDEVAQLFQPFARGRDTTVQGGSGLGLAIANMMAQSMGGDLTYQPREGGGASFIVRLQRPS